PEYLTLAPPLAKARGVRLLLWFAHPADSWRLATAERLADRILTSLPGSYPRSSPKVLVIGQAIDTDRYALMPTRSGADRELRLVAIGRMSDAKRYDLALDAVCIARARGVDVSLRIVGPSLNAAERVVERDLRGAIESRGVAGSAHLEPAVEPSSIPEVFGAADALPNTTLDGSG